MLLVFVYFQAEFFMVVVGGSLKGWKIGHREGKQKKIKKRKNPSGAKQMCSCHWMVTN